ncbi:MAG: ATP synthase F1 subunit epsilon [Kofleriaceae bacterium]|nr:MAG: ATP synthase F1 subunit epsilon [Kofleriaceae bacterium]MBZ0235856.1 ATP synthase F1 subunit epsilon [Kofleriaceae bacterium]
MAEAAKQITGATGALDVNLVTPKGVVAHEAATGLTAPGELGMFELLPGHIPLLTALRPGVLTIGGGRFRGRYAVSTGYLRVDPAGNVEVLVEQAVPSHEVDVEKAKADLKVAESDLASWGDKPTDGDWVNLLHRVQWAQARIDAAATAH